MHLLHGRELGFRNALTGNAKRCTKHKILQTCDNINGCDVYYDDCVYSYLATCHCVIRGFRDQHYSEFRSRTDVDEVFLYNTYVFNVVEECEDIYIEIRSYLDGELQMTIDAKTISPKLSVPLEDKEWVKLKNMKWGALIKENYGNTIVPVDYFTELHGETIKDMWWELLFKKKLRPHYYISHSLEGEPILLLRAGAY